MSSFSVSGEVYAQGLQDKGRIEAETENQTTSREGGSDSENTSERTGPLTTGQFCAKGTGPGTKYDCLPCDPGLGLGNCKNTETGEVKVLSKFAGGDNPLNKTFSTTSPVTNKTSTKGILDKEVRKFSTGDVNESYRAVQAKLKKFQAINDPVKRVEFLFQDLENRGKIPPNSAQVIKAYLTGAGNESTKVMLQACKITETDKYASAFTRAIGSSPMGGCASPTGESPSDGTIECGFLCGVAGGLLVEGLLYLGGELYRSIDGVGEPVEDPPGPPTEDEPWECGPDICY